MYSSRSARDKATMYWIDPTCTENVDKKQPVLELTITKCKETSFKGMLYFKHKSDSCFMEEMSMDEARLLMEQNASKFKEEHGSNTEKKAAIY